MPESRRGAKADAQEAARRRVAILCDGETLTRWQRETVRQLGGRYDLFLIVCRSHRSVKRRLDHLAYYALNVVSLRNSQTRRVAFPDAELGPVETIEVEAAFEGAWASLPGHLAEWLAERKVDAVLKFALDLLRIDDRFPPILSYHHGDPRAFRGRPAGFYEMEAGRPHVGQIVQILSNRIDGGAVVAFAETKVSADSYRTTMTEAFAASPHLIAAALTRLFDGRTLDIGATGPNYRLPGNLKTLAFFGRLAVRKARKILYGLFVEKRWRVSTFAGGLDDPLSGLVERLEAGREGWSTPAIDKPYVFFADGFDHPDGLLVEALNGRTGVGEIIVAGGPDGAAAGASGRHLSYPFVFEDEGEVHVVPETAQWAGLAAYRLVDGRLDKTFDIAVDGDPRVLDPSLIRVEDRIFLFGNVQTTGANVLHLWSAERLAGPFRLHPMSPIHVGTPGGRMGGGFIRQESRLFRIGQDFEHRYGSGLVAFEILEMTDAAYREVEVRRVGFGTVHGPHTLSAGYGRWVFDWYDERVTPLAGVRRVLQKLARMRGA